MRTVRQPVPLPAQGKPEVRNPPKQNGRPRQREKFLPPHRSRRPIPKRPTAQGFQKTNARHQSAEQNHGSGEGIKFERAGEIALKHRAGGTRPAAERTRNPGRRTEHTWQPRPVGLEIKENGGHQKPGGNRPSCNSLMRQERRHHSEASSVSEPAIKSVISPLGGWD